MNWACSGCGATNEGGLFCVDCGAKKGESENVQGLPTVESETGRSGALTSNVPWLVTGLLLIGTLAFGGWQASQASSAESDIALSTKKLSSARSAYNEAVSTAASADSLATTCLYASWCWSSTYTSLLLDAQNAQDVADAAGMLVTKLEGDLSTAQDNLEKYSSVRNTSFILGGVATVGSGAWAYIATTRRKKQATDN